MSLHWVCQNHSGQRAKKTIWRSIRKNHAHCTKSQFLSENLISLKHSIRPIFIVKFWFIFCFKIEIDFFGQKIDFCNSVYSKENSPLFSGCKTTFSAAAFLAQFYVLKVPTETSRYEAFNVWRFAVQFQNRHDHEKALKKNVILFFCEAAMQKLHSPFLVG